MVAKIGGPDESTSGWGNDKMSDERLKIFMNKCSSEQMNKLPSKQKDDDCVAVNVHTGCAGLVHMSTCWYMNEGGIMEETK